MKEYVLIKKSIYEKLVACTSTRNNSNNNESDVGKNNNIPLEVQLNIDNKKILEEANKNSYTMPNKFLTHASTQVDLPSKKESDSEGEHEEKSHIKQKNIRILPVYVNTLPKEYREKAQDILEDLVSQGLVEIDHNGFITKPGVEGMIGYEEFIRSIMIKNASIGSNGMLLREIAYDINPSEIRNSKVLALIGHGQGQKPTWIRCVFVCMCN